MKPGIDLDAIAEHWPLAPLGLLYDIARGGSPRPIKEYITDDPDGLNWIKIGDAPVGSKYIFETKQKIKPSGLRKSRLVVEGDFLLSNSMSFGRPYIMRTSGCIHDGWLVLKPKEQSLDPDFAFYLLGSPLIFQQFDQLAGGSVVRNLNSELVRSVQVPVPPLAEQERIVAILDEAFDGIATATAHAERNLQNARELFQSVLQSTFEQKGDDWVETTLSELSTKIGSGATPRGGQAAYKTEGISLIRSMNVHDREFRRAKLAFIDENQAKKLQNVIIEKNDVLLNITGASVARCCVAPSDVLPARVNQHVSIIRAKPEMVESSFLNQLLTSRIYKDLLLGIGEEGGATRQAITKAQIQEFIVLLPPLDQQKSIVQKLDALADETRRLEAIYQRKLDVLAELKQSLLQRAFSGELTKEPAMSV